MALVVFITQQQMNGSVITINVMVVLLPWLLPILGVF